MTLAKLAEDSDALVLRGVELEGHTDQLRVGRVAIDIPPRGIVTALVRPNEVVATDGLERTPK